MKRRVFNVQTAVQAHLIATEKPKAENSDINVFPAIGSLSL
jgi:hypothetical protein